MPGLADSLPTLLALALATLGCACFYLASPHQRWRTRPWPARPARGLGGLLWCLSLLALMQDMQAVTATFILATVVMLVLTLLPYTGALLALRRLDTHEQDKA